MCFNFVYDSLVGDDSVVDLTSNSEEYREAQVGCCLARPRLYSVDPEYMSVDSKPGPGDLVIANLGEINHPARFEPEFGKGFLILGAVVGFKGVDLSVVEVLKRGVSWESFRKKERLFVDWSPIESSHVRYVQISSKNRSGTMHSRQILSTFAQRVQDVYTLSRRGPPKRCTM